MIFIFCCTSLLLQSNLNLTMSIVVPYQKEDTCMMTSPSQSVIVQPELVQEDQFILSVYWMHCCCCGRCWWWMAAALLLRYGWRWLKEGLSPVHWPRRSLAYIILLLLLLLERVSENLTRSSLLLLSCARHDDAAAAGAAGWCPANTQHRAYS